MFSVFSLQEELAAQLSPLENALKDVGELSSQQSKKVENLKVIVTFQLLSVASNFIWCSGCVSWTCG